MKPIAALFALLSGRLDSHPEILFAERLVRLDIIGSHRPAVGSTASQAEVDTRQILQEAAEAAAAVAPDGDLDVLPEIGSAWARIGDKTAAVNTFDRVLRAAVGMTNRQSELPLFLAQLAETRAKAGDVAGALRTAKAISDPQVTAYCFWLVATALAEAGNFQDALEAAEAAQDKASVLATIAAAKAHAGDFDGALEIAKLIEGIQSVIR